MFPKKKPYKRIALAFSLCLILLWAMLGTGASLAWFTDTSSEIKNIFHMAEFDLEVSYRQKDGSYAPLEGSTAVFDDAALYEPGFTQVVYLRIENKGSVPFDFKTAVNVTGYTEAINAFGESFRLQEFLRFGVVTAESEAALEEALAEREAAIKATTMKLNHYATEPAALAAEGTIYMALIVGMPTSVGNEANYRGDVIPTVELGVIVSATQQNK